ncbi:MAG TPA: hypothetical protein VFG68_21055 [Fimbriiglobus sp.]|nr:hypothetical protein [Fimbriiglobus sp.]
MTRLALGLLVLLPGLGCVHLQPVGPFAGDMAGAAPTNPTPGVTVATPSGETPRPIVQPAPAPAPPALLVTPGEVTEANHAEAARRLMEELEADRRSMDAMPRPAEISIIKR